MASFDIFIFHQHTSKRNVKSLCTKPLQKSNICWQFHEKCLLYLLKITMFDSFFIFDGNFFEQCDGVAMGSPSGTTSANVFMCKFENI